MQAFSHLVVAQALPASTGRARPGVPQPEVGELGFGPRSLDSRARIHGALLLCLSE